MNELLLQELAVCEHSDLCSTKNCAKEMRSEISDQGVTDVQIAGFGRRRFLLDRLRFLVRAFTCDVLAREISLAEGSRHVPILTNMHAVRGPKKELKRYRGYFVYIGYQ